VIEDSSMAREGKEARREGKKAGREGRETRREGKEMRREGKPARRGGKQTRKPGANVGTEGPAAAFVLCLGSVLSEMRIGKKKKMNTGAARCSGERALLLSRLLTAPPVAPISLWHRTAALF